MRNRKPIIAMLMLACSVGACGQVSLGAAIDLALRGSNQVKIAEDDQARALATLAETKDVYIPALTFSSGLAKATGFPPGDPSTFKIAAQGLIFNEAQPQFIKAARSAWKASVLATQNARQEVIFDAASTYAELDADTREMAALHEQEEAARDMARILEDRANAGLEPQLAMKKAQLRAAQARLKRLDIEGRADFLREHLAGLTRMTADLLRTAPESVPPFPPVVPQQNAVQLAIDSNAGLKSAYEEAKSKQFLAKAQHRVNFRPEIDLILQYGYLYDFNNYSRYYTFALPPSEVVAGVGIAFPLFNRVQDAKAREADAEAAKALHTADQQKEQMNEHLVQLRRAVEQTDAAAEVARLQQDISAQNLEALQLRAQQGGEMNGTSVNPADVSGAVLEERGLEADFIAAEFEHTRAELQWMRAVGTLADWARSSLTGATTGAMGAGSGTNLSRQP